MNEKANSKNVDSSESYKCKNNLNFKKIFFDTQIKMFSLYLK